MASTDHWRPSQDESNTHHQTSSYLLTEDQGPQGNRGKVIYSEVIDSGFGGSVFMHRENIEFKHKGVWEKHEDDENDMQGSDKGWMWNRKKWGDLG